MPKINTLPDIDDMTGAKLVGSDSSGKAVQVPVSSLQGSLQASNNLSELTDKEAARTNLGLGTAAVADAGDFAAAGALRPADIGTSVQAQNARVQALADMDDGTTGQVIALASDGSLVFRNQSGGGGGGSGDMEASVYDPNGVEADAFDMDNMVEGTNTKIMTAAERTAISTALQPDDIGDTVQAYDADTAKTDTAQTWSGKQQFGQVTGTVTAMPALDLNCALGNDFTKTIAGASTFTVSNVPSGKAFDLRLILTYTSGTITWFSGIEWLNDATPVLTGGKVYEIIFTTINGGTTWRAVAGEYDD